MSIIKIENMSFGYTNGAKTLNNINLEINEGEFVAIIGENGSGKSSLIKCILGLNKIQSGKITVTERIGYLPQITEIQNNFPASIEEIVLSGTIPNNVRKIFYTKEDKEKAKEVMIKLNLYDIRKKCFYELSGGQRQRVLIARALCSTDKILLMDEPVNGLDPKIMSSIYEMLYNLNKEEGITIIMVSHDVERTLKYCSRVIEVENGRIIQDVQATEYKKGGNIDV